MAFKYIYYNTTYLNDAGIQTYIFHCHSDTYVWCEYNDILVCFLYLLDEISGIFL